MPIVRTQSDQPVDRTPSAPRVPLTESFVIVPRRHGMTSALNEPISERRSEGTFASAAPASRWMRCDAAAPSKGACYLEESMDALRDDDIARARETPPGEKLRQALELMELGIALQRRKLQAAAPTASDAEIDARLLAWMSAAR